MSDLQFKLKNGEEYIPLCNLLKVTGLCDSGANSKIAVEEGLVNVDGQIELRKRCKIRAGQVVEINDQKLRVL